ncbi:MAG: phosphotransferase [Myxococcota bacterium]
MRDDELAALAERAREVAPAFAPGREVRAVAPLGSGHIHATLRVALAGAGPDLVLQSLNEHVFPDVGALMANVERVTAHLRARAPRDGDERAVLRVVRAADGALVARDAAGTAWRAFVYARGTFAIDVVPTDELAFRTARAFGAFAAALADLDPASLALPIPGFHDLAGRLAQLERAVAADRVGRLRDVGEELARARSLGAEVGAALDASGALALPARPVHNDCKINNLLFDEATREPVCVVDLDTVMPGTLLADFGELVRTATCRAAEDERDLALVDFDAARFDALARGYVEGLGGAASDGERDALWLGGPWMALENAVRFLADHLDGDRYFRPRRPDHNLHRTRAQLHLAEQLWRSRDALRETLARAAGKGARAGR